jgi:hypothetical protein
MTATQPPLTAQVAAGWAAFASLGAGLVHLAVAPEHAGEWWLYGVFFVTIGIAQLGWAVVTLRVAPVLPRTFVAATVLTLLLWGLTRTVGLPFGPEAFEPESVGLPDLACAVLEAAAAVLVVVAAASSTRTGRARTSMTPGRQRPGLLLAALALGAVTTAALTTPALAATPAGHHAHHHTA